MSSLRSALPDCPPRPRLITDVELKTAVDAARKFRYHSLDDVYGPNPYREQLTAACGNLDWPRGLPSPNSVISLPYLPGFPLKCLKTFSRSDSATTDLVLTRLSTSDEPSAFVMKTYTCQNTFFAEARAYSFLPPCSSIPHCYGILPKSRLLFEYIKSSEPISPNNITPAIALSAARVLQDVIHAAAILHDDIAPRNILIARDEKGWRVVFIDFGTQIPKNAGGLYLLMLFICAGSINITYFPASLQQERCGLV